MIKRACILLFLINYVNPFENHKLSNDFNQNINRAARIINFKNKFPDKYEKLARTIAKATDSGNLFSHAGLQNAEYRQYSEPNQNFGDGLAAENVTDIPFNSTTESYTTVGTTSSPTPTISELCLNQTEAIQQALQTQQYWALRMIDAAGKPPANILGGGVQWLGDFEECLNVVNVTTTVDDIKYRFDGQYCKVYIPLENALGQLMPEKTMITLGVCVPNSCSSADAAIIVNNLLSSVSSVQLEALPGECHNPNQSFDTRAIIVLVVLSVIVAIMVVGTFYDIVFIQFPKWQSDKKETTISGESVVEADEKMPLVQKEGHKKEETGIGGKLLLAFSVYTNGAKILSTEQSKDVLTSINGIRFISMTWVILGHTYAFPLQLSDNIITFFPQMTKRWTFEVIGNALVSVDTFFTLSGCLLTYLVMKELKKNNGKMNWGMFYFHRFWRLTPPYMLVLMVYVSLFQYTGTGPNWAADGPEVNHCEKSWYYNLLYINNFFDDREKQCMSWSWYLACDMQFFVLSPLIILPMFFFPVVGFGVMMIFLLATWITTGVLSSHYDIPASPLGGVNMGGEDHWNEIYFRSYCRMGPYLVGMLTGYFLHKTNCNVRMNKFLNLLGWGLATAAALAVLYGLHEDKNGHPLSTEVAALYNTVHRTVWGACISWVIFACATGYGGFVNTILSWKGFIPLSRLTYMAYLVHIIVMYHYLMTYQRMFHLSDSVVIYQFLGHLGLSYAAAFITSLAFESPMMGLERVIFKRDERKR